MAMQHTAIEQPEIVGPWRYEPTHAEIDALILRAARHPLGPEFLQHGALDSVSAIFDAHAFVVEQARERLGVTTPDSEPGFPGR